VRRSINDNFTRGRYSHLGAIGLLVATGAAVPRRLVHESVTFAHNIVRCEAVDCFTIPRGVARGAAFALSRINILRRGASERLQRLTHGLRVRGYMYAHACRKSRVCARACVRVVGKRKQKKEQHVNIIDRQGSASQRTTADKSGRAGKQAVPMPSRWVALGSKPSLSPTFVEPA
jgi:hypothetical protein